MNINTLLGLFGSRNKDPRADRHQLQNFDILSLSGGGIMGLYTARILEHIEHETGRPAARNFDMVCGSSIGGLIALALSREVPAQEIVQTFYNNVNHIFTPRQPPSSGRSVQSAKLRKLAAQMTKTRYNAEPLHKVVIELLGEETTLGQAMHPVMVTAYDLTSGKLKLFTAPIPSNGALTDLDIALHDIAMATSAVPAVFPIHQIEDHRYVDGGVFANAPDVLAFREAIFHLSVPMNKIRMCSIGTMTSHLALPANFKNDNGIAAWGEKNRLPTLVMASQQQFTTSFMKDILKDNYLRIDSIQPNTTSDTFDPQAATKEELDAITRAADTTWKFIRGEQLLKRMTA